MSRKTISVLALAAIIAAQLVCAVILSVHGNYSILNESPLLGTIMYSLSVMTLVVFTEILVVGYDQSSWRAIFDRNVDQSIGYDVFLYILVIVGYNKKFIITMSIGLILIADGFHEEIIDVFSVSTIVFSSGYIALDFAGYLLAWSFFDYWNHRIMHMHPLWFLHRMHHSASDLTIFTTARNNPFALVIEPLVRVWPLAIFAPKPEFLIVAAVIEHSYQMLAHSRIRSNWGWFGRWVLLSPADHRIHHSVDPKHYNKNLSVAVIWDRVFGTWIPSDGGEIVTGVVDAGHNSGNIVKDIYRDGYIFVRSIVGLQR